MKSEFKEQLALPAELVSETARAVGFLSRIPLPARVFAGHDEPLSELVRSFPLAGLIVSLPAALLLALLTAIGAVPLVAGFLVVSLQVAVTGALHEDGLADTADGIGAGRDRDRALAIMKDSRNGTYGTLALVLSVGLRAAAVAALSATASPVAAMAVFLGMAAASRAAMVWHWQALPPARADGVAAGAGAPSERNASRAIAIGVALLVVCVAPTAGLLAGSAAVATVALVTAAFIRYVGSRLEGHTGDTIGAAQQLAEIAGLAVIVLAFHG